MDEKTTEAAPDGMAAAHRAMRLSKREISDLSELRSIAKRATVLHVASHDAEGPFIVPMTYGFEVVPDESAVETGGARWTFWLHCAGEGRKHDAWLADPEVALELDVPSEVISGAFACNYSLAYESIMATAQMRRVFSTDDKLRGLNALMDHMAPDAPKSFSPDGIERVDIWRADVTRLTGKRRA